MKAWHLTFALMAVVPAFAQHADQSPSHGTQSQAQNQHSVYAGMQSRDIKSLSDQQMMDLRAGKGASFALPAELNGYPGPSHTLELASQLELSEEQKAKTKRLFEQMQAEAKVLGDQLISSEYELDHLFKEKKATPESVQEAVAKAARVQGQLRASHLRYHLSMVDVLTPAQVARYNQLRGYQ